MKKEFLLAPLMILSAVAFAASVGVRTTCGIVVYTIDKATFNENVAYPGYTYLTYLKELNEEYCGVSAIPFIVDYGDRAPVEP